MTGPDCIPVWIALGTVASLAILGTMWALVARALAEPGEDAGDQGAEEGWVFHNGADL